MRRHPIEISLHAHAARGDLARVRVPGHVQLIAAVGVQLN